MDDDWSPRRGWTILGVHLAVRSMLGCAVMFAAAWALNALCDSVGATGMSTILPFLSGGVGGAIAGVLLCGKLSETTGLAGRTILPAVLAVILAVQVGGWYIIEASIPWALELRMYFIAASAVACGLVMVKLVWVEA